MMLVSKLSNPFLLGVSISSIKAGTLKVSSRPFVTPIASVPLTCVYGFGCRYDGCLRVVRGGGENRKKTAIAFALSITVALMMLAQPVSAGTITSLVEDSEGDLGFGVNPKTGGIMQQWGENTPVAKAGYLDMVSTWLSQKGKTYTFGMELAAELPKEGSTLSGGMRLVEWAMWIDPSPYNYITNPVAPLFLIALRYDGSSYSAFILDYSTMLTESVAFSVDGSELQLQFSTDTIGNAAFEWWSPLVRVWWGPLGTPAYWFVDAVDLPPVDGYVYIDLPWPPV